jgi:hypothetical protein
VRGIYPVVATITADGFARLEDQDIAHRFQALLARLSIPGSATAVGLAPTIDDGGAGR